MFGNISGFSYSPYYASLAARNTSQTTPAEAHSVPQSEQVSTPVQPVSPTREVISNDTKFSIESMLNQHESDPVAMAARMRIQYPGQTTQQPKLPGADNSDVQNKELKSAQEVFEEGECQTCANRKYQDGSDDPGVSFKTATKLSPEEAATAVRGHEMEHVVREQAKAAREDREVVSQSVTINTAICPECGTVYASGGTTRTVTKGGGADVQQQIPEQDPASNPVAA